MNGFVPPKIKQARVFVCRDAIGLKSSAFWLRRKPTWSACPFLPGEMPDNYSIPRVDELITAKGII
jgi:hypothetical protein